MFWQLGADAGKMDSVDAIYAEKTRSKALRPASHLCSMFRVLTDHYYSASYPATGGADSQPGSEGCIE